MGLLNTQRQPCTHTPTHPHTHLILTPALTLSTALQELSSLWSWQHRRVAQGLPHESTQAEAQEARAAAVHEAMQVTRLDSCIACWKALVGSAAY